MRILVSGSTCTVARVAERYPDSLGVLKTPANGSTIKGVLKTGLPWALDNGAYSGLDTVSFRRCLRRAAEQPRLLWVVCPDVVGDAAATLRLFDQWEPELSGAGVPVAFVGQDGQENLSVPWERFDCFFVGGTTRWKLSREAACLVAQAKLHGKYVHMGRVNTLRRLRYALELDCDTVDGSCFSRWADRWLAWAIRYVNRQRQQPMMF